jgi:hypothetical protein
MTALLVVKEDSAHGISFLLQRLEELNLDVNAFFIQPFESLTSHQSLALFADPLKFDPAKEYPASSFTASEERIIARWLNTSPWMNGAMHGRDFFQPTQDEAFEYVTTCFNYYVQTLRDNNITLVIDLESDNPIRCVLDIACQRLKIPYKVAFNTRINGTVKFGNGVINPFSPEDFSQLRELVPEKKDLELLTDFRKKQRLSADEQKFVNRNNEITILTTIKEILRSSFFHIKRYFKTRSQYRQLGPLYVGYTLKFLLWSARRNLRKYIMSKRRSVFHYDVDSVDYIYFPLGQIAEGAEPSFSNRWPNDLICLDHLKCNKPILTEIIVKDHRSMLGERPMWHNHFIANNTPAVISGKTLIDYDANHNPIKLIQECVAVAGLSGSALVEALLMGKSVFIYGEPIIYNMLKVLQTDRECDVSDIDTWWKLHDIDAARLLMWSKTEALDFSLYSIKRYDGVNNTLDERSVDIIINELAELIDDHCYS